MGAGDRRACRTQGHDCLRVNHILSSTSIGNLQMLSSSCTCGCARAAVHHQMVKWGCCMVEGRCATGWAHVSTGCTAQLDREGCRGVSGCGAGAQGTGNAECCMNSMRRVAEWCQSDCDAGGAHVGARREVLQLCAMHHGPMRTNSPARCVMQDMWQCCWPSSSQGKRCLLRLPAATMCHQ